jgi:hypothetical protein
MNSDRFTILPYECIQKIIEYLPVKDIKNIKLQNKRLKSIANSSYKFLTRIKLYFKISDDNINDLKYAIEWINKERQINHLEFYCPNDINNFNVFKNKIDYHFKLKLIEINSNLLHILNEFDNCNQLYIRSFSINHEFNNSTSRFKLKSIKKLQILFDFIDDFIRSNEELNELHAYINFGNEKEYNEKDDLNKGILSYKRYRVKYWENVNNVRLREDHETCTRILDLFELNKRTIKEIQFDDYRGSTNVLLNLLNLTKLDSCRFYLCDLGVIFEEYSTNLKFSTRSIDFDGCGFDFIYETLRHIDLSELEVFKLRTIDNSIDGPIYFGDILNYLNGKCPNLIQFETQDDLYDHLIDAEYLFPRSLRVLKLNSFMQNAESFEIAVKNLINFEGNSFDKLEILETKYFFNCVSPIERDKLDSLLMTVHEKYPKLKQFKMTLLCNCVSNASHNDCTLRSELGLIRENFEYKFRFSEFFGCSKNYRQDLNIIIELGML